MQKYHKIRSPFNRDPVTNKLVKGSWSLSELDYLQNNQWVGSEKVDGTNIRVMWNGKEVSFNGKTDNAQLHMDLIKKLQEIFVPQTPLFAEKFGESQVCLYGEGYGAGIQKGGVYRQDKNFVLFDVWIDDIWLERGNVEGVAEMLGIDVVPVVKTGTLNELIEYIETSPNSTWGDFSMEGIVARRSHYSQAPIG